MSKNSIIEKLSRRLICFIIIIFSMILSMVIGLSGFSEASEEKLNPPSQFVQKLGNNTMMSLTIKNVSREIRENRVRKILRNNFDIQTIGRFALGTYWREATKPQRKEYMSLFEEMIVQTYTTRFEDYSGQILKVTGETKAGDRDFLVFSKILQEDGPPINLEWRVRNKNNKLKIIDVVVEGISMSITQRADFSSVIQRGGGKIEALLTSLRKHGSRKI
ncbi:MAG: ABC transporter substrate-binding protein [Alphaproteobacteria bacterium]|nr:ABC transporter substrate-binding protein [Alphaproteobacteria bacterium]MCK5658927.1 ABC transporter substrate-binding protein [Alphaproteobacteria bacterium]